MLSLLISSLVLSVSCQPQPVKTVEVSASVNCDPSVTRCYSVTPAFVAEHRALMVTNLRLKKECK